MSNPSAGVCAQQIHICNLESAMEAARVVFPQSQLFFPAHEPWICFQFSWLCASSIIPDKCCLSAWFGACHVSAGPLWPTTGCIPSPVEYNPWHHTASVENANYFYSNSTDMEIYRETCIYLQVRSMWCTVRKEIGKEFENSAFLPDSGMHQPGSTVWHMFTVTTVGFLLALCWFNGNKLPIAFKMGLY